MTRLFDHKNMGDYKRFDHAIWRFTEYASDWFNSYQSMCRREGKEELATWTDLRAEMKKRFIPRT